MPRNGSGVQSIPNTMVDGTTITAAAHNANYVDIGAELTNSLALDGQSQMIGQFKAASGTVGSPGIAFASDLDSGIYRIGGDNIGIGVGGTKILDIASTGLAVTGTLSSTGAASVAALTAASLALTADLPITEGGTGQSTATAAFDALSPNTTRGDVTVRGASNNVRLAIGAADTVLKANGTDPSWAKIVNANITDGTIAFAKLAADCLPARGYGEYTSNADLSGTIPFDDTIPQDSEGDQIVTASITLKFSTSRVRVSLSGFVASATDSWQFTGALFSSVSANAIQATRIAADSDGGATNFYPVNMEVEHAPGSVGPLTYQFRAGGGSATYRFNGTTSGRSYGGAARVALILQEVFV